MNSKKDFFKEHLDIINKMIDNKRPKFEIARLLGVKYETLNKYLKEFGINYSGNQNRKGISHPESRTTIDEYLNGRKYISASVLKNRLIDEGLKEYKCEQCGRVEWEGRKIPLELHHKNMNHFDNRLDNLQILCSNCHSLAHDYCNTKGKPNPEINLDLYNQIISEIKEDKVKIERKTNTSKKRKNNKVKNIEYCIHCGKKLKNEQKKFCSQECAHKHISKIPDINTLLSKLNEFNWNKTQTGKYFGVSDNAVRKWIKKYDIIK